MSNKLVDASDIAQKYYTDYSKYVFEYRALPSVYDGLKAVQRRIIYAAYFMPNKLVKSANLTGEVMKYHPHGDSYGAVVNIASKTCKLPLFDTKGNFGGFGYGASSSRYTELKLSDIAKFIHCQFLDYAEMIKGELNILEPAYMPSLIPYSLMEGTSNMAVGLATNIIPLNMMDVIDYYISYIENDGPKDGIFPKPDFGDIIIDLTDEETELAVKEYKGWVSLRSIIKQESDNVFVVDSLYGRSIDKVVKKLSWYIDSDKVDFRNESSLKERYVFEVVDRNTDPQEFRKYLEKATVKRNTFTRVMVDSGNAVYCSLDYVVSKSLQGLNKAIDKKLIKEREKYDHSIELLEGLKRAKESGVFDNVVKLTKDELVNKIIKLNITESISKEIVSKPISYLTRSHDYELDNIYSKIKEIESHDRKSYLIGMYNQLKDMVKDIYNSKYHSIMKSQVLKNPKIKLVDEYSFEISDSRRGIKFDSTIYLLGEDGGIYIRKISSVSKSILMTGTTEKIIGIVSDYSKYVEIRTNDDKGLSVELSELKYDKKIANLQEGQKVIKAIGHNENAPEFVLNNLKSRVSKVIYYERN